MKTEKKLFLILIAGFVFLLNSCKTINMKSLSFNKVNPNTVAKKKSSNKKPKTVKVSPETILDKILTGIEKNNYSYFSKRFDENLKKSLNEKKFNLLREGLIKTLGNYVDRTYMGSLEKGDFTVYIWKGRFSNIKDTDMVIYLTLGKPDKKIKVFDFMISGS